MVDINSAVVTGGLGGSGSWVVDNLAKQGVDVLCIDQFGPSGNAPDNVSFYQADLTEQGEAWELIEYADPDAVIHFANIPRMGVCAGSRTFENNTLANYNVMVAAGRVGAEVVWTSSECTYGTVFTETTELPEYFPIDEAHPTGAPDPYGTSKVVGEEIAKMVTRRYGVPITSIRPSWINYPGEYFTTEIRESFDPEMAAITGDRNTHIPSGNFWSYIDIRDIVSLVDAVLDADIEGHEVYLGVADENYLGRSTAETIEAVFGDVPDECALEGEQSALSNAKAKAELDWKPVHTWQSALNEDVPGPSFVEN
jgi:nucleoside-diphosphate-sugar epimerase